MQPSALTILGYLVTSVSFMFGIQLLRSPANARQGNRIAGVGMLLVIGITAGLIGSNGNWAYIVPPVVIGSLLGAVSARSVRMTAMPQMVALFNGMGGGSAALIAAQDFREAVATGTAHPDITWAVMLSCIIGSISFSGSMIAFAKLQELLPGRPLVYPLQKLVNAGLLLAIAGIAVYLIVANQDLLLFAIFVALALVLGVLFVVPIGGADMPVIISLLNSFTGLAAAMTGFVLSNDVLIVSGALVGASGTILTQQMSKAMNRSLFNVLFGAFGATVETPGAEGAAGAVHPTTVEDLAPLLAFAHQVVFVPGYGMAVARAQHDVKELADELERHGVEVKYGIHPVAGRMPGHMNVLLAEADVPYPQLKEMDAINPEFPRTDVAVVIGANDVVNPAARSQPGSPIYGMPILNVDEAKTVVVLKRSMNPGFAGVDNPLFYLDNTLMLFGDARSSVQQLVEEVARQ
ncbi:MAG TPA: NAD(P)(+) transhydrogenase (Re/Si-specific) subunit beta [Candidatus Dormibacteraeota bacterium]|nr:NAD(P)(+) transhydrogenase (Re/Si-specific) subunit beta [Candidatus Dormibacteraeota bacterium]